MPVARLNFRNHHLASLFLAVLFVVSMAISLRSSWDRFDEMLHGADYVSEGFDLDTQTFAVIKLDSATEQAGLRKGDIVTAVNGRQARGWSDIEVPVRRARTDEHLLLHVSRGGGSTEKDIPAPLRQFTYVGYSPGSAQYVVTILFRILTPLFCVALGFWVAAVRIGDRAAWALLLMMLSVANLVTDDRTTFGHEGAVAAFLTGVTFFYIHLGPLALVYFGIVFPEPLAFDRKFPWIKWIVIAPMLARAGLTGIAGGLAASHRDMILRLWAILMAIGPAATDVTLGLIGLFFVILGYKSLTATTRDARRRFLLLDTGAAVGLLPFLITLTWVIIRHAEFHGWPALVSIAALLLFPLSMAYVIVVHRAMDVRVVLRQGMQYLLATSGIRILQIVISAGIIVLTATIG